MATETEKKARMFKYREVEERFFMPEQTARNWYEDEVDSWRYKMYVELETIMIRELAAKVDEINND